MSGFGEAPLKLSGSLMSYGDTAEYAIDPNEEGIACFCGD